MANILVMQIEGYQARVIEAELRRHEHRVSIVDRDISPDRVCDVVAERLRDEKIDIFFIDGMIAYNSRLRRSLVGNGIERLPLLVSYLRFFVDEDIIFSGCDFGKDLTASFNDENYPSDIAAAILQSPIRMPLPHGVNYNPGFWREENGLIVRR